MVGEFAGTFMMMLLGDGVVAACLLKGTKATGEGWLVITTAWAFAVLCGIFTANLFGSSDAHLNPAITVAFGILNGDMSKVVPYACAQISGAFAAAVMVWLFYFPHWTITDNPAAKLGIFCTAPAVSSPLANLASEIIGTMVLVIVAGAIFSHGVSLSGPAAGVGPWLVGSLVWGIGLSLGGTTGYAINPARDLGPRLTHFILPIPGKGGSNWRYAPIPIIGDLAGGALAGLLLHYARL